MMKIIKFILLIAIILVVWFLVALHKDNRLKQSQIFVLDSGWGLNKISQELHDQGFIKSKFVFEFWLELKKAETNIIAGSYLFPAKISIYDLSKTLTSGPQDSQSAITLLEGWTRDLMAQALTKKGFSGNEFLQLTAKKTAWQADYNFLQESPNNASLEGYLYPDTYFIDKNTTIENLIIKALNNFDKKLTPELRQEISQQGKTIFEIVTLASIVEREVPNDADKKMIADIFWKRLQASIGLQSDATINFITGKGLAQPTAEDLQVDSPYNTYKYRGLPPGPISNPSIESIKAVIYPTSNSYYYFLTTPEGETIYSRDYDEHLQNKYKYLTD